MVGIKKLRTAGFVLTSWVLYFFSFLAPRNKKIWIFIGWHKNQEREIFADNAKYLFLHVANTSEDVRAIWIGGDKKICGILNASGYECYSINSKKGIYFSLRAGYTFVDTFIMLRNWRYSGLSKIVQLWHGEGIKKILRNDVHFIKKYNKITSPNLFKRYHFIITSSKYIAKKFISPSFGVEKNNIRITGLPRYDILFNEIVGSRIDINLDLENKIKKIKLQNPKKIILYAPTFRREKSVEDPLSAIKLSELNKFFQKRRYFMIVTLHPKFATEEWMPKNTFSNIFFVHPDYDAYPLLSNFDLLITDYSSICLEFLLLEKQIIFFVYDIEEYKKDPGLIEDVWELLPGPRATNFDDLLKALETNHDEWKGECKSAKEKLFNFKNGTSSQSIIEQITKL